MGAMLWQLGKLLAKGYALLLTAAAGGFVGANVAGFVPAVIQFAGRADKAPNPGFARSWMHGGWMAGCGLFLAGAIWNALPSMRKDAQAMKRSAKKRRSSRPEESRSESGRSGVYVGSKRCGFLGSLGVGGLVGAFLGLFLGASFLLLLFSLSYSPFTPEGWDLSIKAEKIGMERPGTDRVLTTDHPLAVYAFLSPIVLGVVVGAILGGVSTIMAGKKDASDDP
jgi:hypothetical protein